MLGTWLGARTLIKHVLDERWPLAQALVGPAASYLACSVLFALSLFLGGRSVATLDVDVRPGAPAELAGLHSGDRIIAVDDVGVALSARAITQAGPPIARAGAPSRSAR